MDNKKRGSNFTPEEKTLLIKLANKYKNIIVNKRTDGTTWKSKEEAWKQIEGSFNSCSSGSPRTSKQLKMKYEGIKKDMKKKCAARKIYLRGTGGGPHVPPPQPPDEEEKELYETISMSLHGLKNPFDSDNTQGEQSLILAASDDLILCDDPAVPDQIETDWSAFNCRMLQTPLHPALNVKNTNIGENIEEDHGIILMEEEHSYPIPFYREGIEPGQKENCTSSVQCNTKKDWHSRRRPVLKKKFQKSVAAKFEDLAMKKQKLIDSLFENAEKAKEEHEIKMKILKQQEECGQIRKRILECELKIVELKYETLAP